MHASNTSETVLVTGATGYVGGRLIGRLAQRDLRVRCMARRPTQLRDRVPDAVEVVQGDVSKPATLDSALRGVDTAFYLVHALGAAGDFEQQELVGAENFANAARAAGVRCIIYLGGLGDTESFRFRPHAKSAGRGRDLTPFWRSYDRVSGIDYHRCRKPFV